MTRRQVHSCDLCRYAFSLLSYIQGKAYRAIRRARKIKCSKQWPCAQCLARGVTCRWNEAQEFRRLFPARAAATPNVLNQLDARTGVGTGSQGGESSTSGELGADTGPTSREGSSGASSEAQVAVLRHVCRVFGTSLGLNPAEMSTDQSMLAAANRMTQTSLLGLTALSVPDFARSAPTSPLGDDDETSLLHQRRHTTSTLFDIVVPEHNEPFFNHRPFAEEPLEGMAGFFDAPRSAPPGLGEFEAFGDLLRLETPTSDNESGADTFMIENPSTDAF